jgi:hypothetical protein
MVSQHLHGLAACIATINTNVAAPLCGSIAAPALESCRLAPVLQETAPFGGVDGRDHIAFLCSVIDRKLGP